MKDDIREVVRKKYAHAITKRVSCCGDTGCCGGNQSNKSNQVTGNLYKADEIEGLSPDMLAASFGCGNPTALANLYAGEVVLDLGSGAGLDVLLSARRVGPTGKAYGLDMTDEMITTAKANQKKAGIDNAEFLKGHIEDIPLSENTVDVVISNCVINLSGDKDRVMREIFRVLKPGGRMAVSDIVLTRTLPEKIQKDVTAWAGCVAGALTEAEYCSKLSKAGFENTEVVVTRIYDLVNSGADLLPNLSQEELLEINGSLISVFIRAKKPASHLAPGKDYAIRRATSGDFNSIRQLLIKCGLPTAGVERNITNFFVAISDSVVGVIGMEYYEQAALIRSLAISPNLRKCGIAEELVQRALAELKSRGIGEVFLLTETAEKYFRRIGFNSIDRKQIPKQLLVNSELEQACSGCSSCMGLTFS